MHRREYSSKEIALKNQKSVLNKASFVHLQHSLTSSIQLLIITNTQHKTMMMIRASSRLLSSTFERKRDINTIDDPAADGGKKRKALSSPTISKELKVLGGSDQLIKEVVPLRMMVWFKI